MVMVNISNMVLWGAEAIQLHMEELNYGPTSIPGLSALNRIIKSYKLRINKI